MRRGAGRGARQRNEMPRDGWPRGSRIISVQGRDVYWSFSTRMRSDEVARGVVASPDPLEGAIDDVPLLAFPELLDAPLAPVAPFDVSFGEVLGELLGELLGVLLGAGPLDASLGALDPLLDAGRFISTSPPDVPVTVLLGDAPLTGTQLVALDAASDVVAAADGARPLDAELELLTPAVAEADVRLALVSPVVDGVVPVPFAPFVVFSPVKR